jgi:crotonobetainyl-CoA:carnitine CoA-transferase CaiB-like acyl-CoA transferase
VQFDGRVPDIGRAPDAFQHTDEILTELGKTRADIADLRELGAVA